MGARQPATGRPPILSLTEAATDRLLLLLQHHPSPGVRIALKSRGCAALSYMMEYVDQPVAGDEYVPLTPEKGLFIQAGAVLFLLGTEMDYEEHPTQAGFLFRNPNEKGRCGCGSSFHI